MTSKKESPMKRVMPINKDRDSRMKKAAEEDAKTRRESALEIVKKSKTKKSFTLDKQRRVKPDHRSFLQEFFCNDKKFKISRSKFPGICSLIYNFKFTKVYSFNKGPQKWKKIWNRAIDWPREDKDTSEKLINIEREMFLNIQREVEGALGVWVGSPEQQHLADLKISSCVRNSFRNYERDNDDYKKQYFYF